MNSTGPGSRVGSRFGPYQLLRLLGRGGMGEVYAAEDTRKQRVVALKLISEQFSGNPVFRARMQREANEAGRLTEPHVVPIHDYGEIDGLLYLEMRLIDGVDLATLVKRSGPLSPSRAVAIVRQIAAALDAAHANGVTHRDVKPENILVTADDFAYLVDFGIARAAGDPGLTQTGTAMGTYKYMAPERFAGAEVTYLADVYSLACVLVECLTGSPPYPVGNVEQAVGAHLTAPPPRPSQLLPGRVPPAIDEVIARGMAKRPEERYRSAGELASAAHQALTEPERHEVTNILRRGERVSPSARTAPAGAGLIAGAAPPGANQPGWTPAAADPGSWRGPPSGGPIRQPDFGRSPSYPGVSPPWYRRKPVLIGAAVLVALIAIVYLVASPSHGPATSAAGQTELPFNGLDFRLSPGGVTLDSDGNVYITSQGMFGRVVKLAPGSSQPTVLPFSGLYQPQALAVDSAGAVYVSDFNNRVVKLPAGSNEQTVLPFDGLNYPEGVAVDSGGSVYVADRGNNRVVMLAAGSNNQAVLPFSGLKNPDGVAVDGSGGVYVTDTDNNRVLKLAKGSSDQTVLPFAGTAVPWGITVDNAGSVYITEHDSDKVLKLASGSDSPTVLPFTGLNTPLDVAVDSDGNVYVADRGNDRVVKLAG
ncbi:MAG TPA: serine/threonine-protein kinase PknD [Mycobacterium sp.]|nr:serine/threonine-protein kinase PknD [Mycobacterium sp.]